MIGLRGQAFGNRRARVGGESAALCGPRLLLLTHELKHGLEIVIDDEVALPAEEIAPLGRIERPEARARVRLKNLEMLCRQHPFPLRKRPPFLVRPPRGVGIEQDGIEVQIVRGAIQRQRQGSARVDAKTAKERAHLDRIAVLLVRIEETTEPGKCVPVIRQADRARLERIGKLREGELGVGNEKRALGRLEERTSPTSDRGATRVDPACMQLKAHRADDAAGIGDKRQRRRTGEPERPSLPRSQRGDGGVRGDNTVGLESDSLRIGVAVQAKCPQAIATRRVARSPRVEVRRSGLRLEDSPQEARSRACCREDDLLVIVGVVKANHRLSAVNTLLRQSPR